MHKTILPLLLASAFFVGKVKAQTAVSGPPYSSQGPYIGWNNLTGGTGETDFVNNPGYGGGGFVFMNTTSSGSPVAALMTLSGTGNLGIGTTSPSTRLTLAGSNTQNPNNSGSAIDYDGEGLTFLNNAPYWGFHLGGIRMVQKNGYYLDNGDMVFSITRAGDQTRDAVTIQGITGNFGIGTASPTAPLEVNGDIKLTAGSEHHLIFPDGSVQSHAWDGVLESADFAESVDVTGERSSFTPGDLLVIDPLQQRQFQKSSEPYSRLISGVYSTKPGALGRHKPRSVPQDAEVPMAMVGIVPTKVSTENGPVHAGDLLVSSSTPGYAMKGTDFSRMTGAVLGKALAPLEKGSGVIEVLVSLQ